MKSSTVNQSTKEKVFNWSIKRLTPNEFQMSSLPEESSLLLFFTADISENLGWEILMFDFHYPCVDKVGGVFFARSIILSLLDTALRAKIKTRANFRWIFSLFFQSKIYSPITLSLTSATVEFATGPWLVRNWKEKQWRQSCKRKLWLSSSTWW